MNVILRKTLIFSLLILLANCEVRFENDIRILAKGELEDQNGNGISDAEISVYTKRPRVSFFGSGQNSFLLGQNISNSDGSFSVISLFDKDEDFSIEVDAGNTYSKYVYLSNTEEYLPPNLVFDLQTVNLYQLGEFNYNISRTSGEGNSIQYSFKYINGYCEEVYNEGVLNEEESNCFEDEFTYGTGNDDNPNREGVIGLPIGTSVEFTYTINDASEITETFTVNQDSYEFIFNY